MSQIKTKFLAPNAVTNAKLATMNDNTVKGNKSGSSAAPTDLALSDITESTSSVLTITNGSKAIIGAANLTIQVTQSSTSTSGYLSSTDWNTFNGKQAAGSYITALTSDVTASGPGSAAATIASNVVTNAKLAQMAAHTFKGNNTASTANAADLTISQMQSELAVPTSSSPLALNAGGTGTSAASATAAFNALSPMTASGDIIYGGTSGAGTRLAKGTDGQFLALASGVPAWTSNIRTINAQTGTTYTFVLADGSGAGGQPLVTLSNASAITATVPPNSSVAFPVGTQIDVAQLGAGKVTLAQGSGVTINSASGNKAISAQYVAVSLIKTATDTWLLIGSLIA